MLPEIIQEHWVIFLITGFIIGLDKGGLKPLVGIGIFLITSVLDSRTMLAVLAPVMFIGEIFPTVHYQKDCAVKTLRRFIPWVIIGLIIGATVGSGMSEQIFGISISIIVLSMGILLTRLEYRPFNIHPTHQFSIRIILGIIAGFGSIIGNMAGGVTNTYYLMHIKDKNTFLGTNARMYLSINGIKLIIYIFFWQVLTPQTLLITASLIPTIILGIITATLLVKVIPEKVYRYIILASIYYAGIAMLIRYV